ncbi:MAG: hypothetical protein M1401_05750 [Chloroflexi bacterium]|nr:hypothetical protein [Chloroflexota bacterium]
MKSASLVVLLPLLLCLVLASQVIAADDAKYNFASAQGEKRIQVAPGGEGRGTLYFYNIDGNRVTHVTLTPSSLPAGWQVSLDPPAHAAQFSVNEQTVTTIENLSVEPSELLVHAVQSSPPGSACIAVPGRGFAVAKEAAVVVRVPNGVPAGTRAPLRVSAEASWLGQVGAASLKQARDFDFTVEIAPPGSGYSERPLPAQPTVVVVAPAGIAGEEPASDFWLPLATLGMVVMAGAGYAAGRRGRRGRSR